MQDRPQLGCFSISAFLGGLFILIFVAGSILFFGGQLFSPGPLNDVQTGLVLGGAISHAATAGNCAACHAAIWDQDQMSDRCLACHTDLIQVSSFHSIMKQQGKLSGCIGCHTEHNGATASLVVFDISNFPHASLGYSLDGHQKLVNGEPFSCKDCHGDLIQVMDLERCITCHQASDVQFVNQHIASYGKKCLDCHDGVDRFGKNFNHQAVNFQLTGKHSQIECVRCHTSVLRTADFKNAPQDCFSCHASADAHAGQFGKDCSSCHTTTGWKPATIDHSKTNFPLVGKHFEVKCEQCHIKNQFKDTPTDCFSCHKTDDTHNGQFGQDCAGCHTPTDWKTVKFDHSKSSFPLTGLHKNVACAKCHINGQFKGTSTICSACHQEPQFHLGLFPNPCETCHSTNGWSPAIFNQNHTFPLNHPDVKSCKDCHTNTLNEYTCFTCHDQNRMTSKHAEEGIRNISNCIQCHASGQKEEGGGGGHD